MTFVLRGFFHGARVLYPALPLRLPGRWRIESFLRQTASKIDLPRNAIVRAVGGFDICVDTTDFLQRQIYLLHQWEPHVCVAMAQKLRPGELFIDVGANIGFLTLYAAMLVGKGGRILSFEPNPP